MGAGVLEPRDLLKHTQPQVSDVSRVPGGSTFVLFGPKTHLLFGSKIPTKKISRTLFSGQPYVLIV